MDVFTPGTHGSTFGGNPLAAAVGIAALDVIVDEELPERAERLGQSALAKLRSWLCGPTIAEVRGCGLLLAVQFKEKVAHQAVVALARRGVLAKDTHDTTVRLAPPLVIREGELSEALETIASVLNGF
jgi:ornithine--oxo-acid transaminase